MLTAVVSSTLGAPKEVADAESGYALAGSAEDAVDQFGIRRGGGHRGPLWWAPNGKRP
jgi:hypothetical protein